MWARLLVFWGILLTFGGAIINNIYKPQALPSKTEGHGGKQRSEGTIRGDNKMFSMVMMVMMVDKVLVIIRCFLR